MPERFIIEGPDFDIAKLGVGNEQHLAGLIQRTLHTCAFAMRDNPDWSPLGVVTVKPVHDRMCSNCDDIRYLTVEFQRKI